MIDLDTLIGSTAKSLSAETVADISHTSQNKNTGGNDQLIDNTDISHHFPISHLVEDDHIENQNNKPNCAETDGITGGGSAREGHLNGWEQWEHREKIEEPTTYISHLDSKEWEQWEITAAPEAQPCRSPSWGECLAKLAPWSDPCHGFRPGTWRSMRAAAIAFCVEFGLQARALGWTDAELFGVHPVAGIARHDCTGALLTGRKVAAVAADRITFENGLVFRRANHGAESVPVWEATPPETVAGEGDGDEQGAWGIKSQAVWEPTPAMGVPSHWEKINKGGVENDLGGGEPAEDGGDA